MQTQIVTIENDEDLAAARAVVAELGNADSSADIARLRAQALILQAYEAERWPSTSASPAEIMAYLMDQLDFTPADFRPLLGKGAAARVSEILGGRKGFSLPQIKRLHARFNIPADALIGEPEGAA